MPDEFSNSKSWWFMRLNAWIVQTEITEYVDNYAKAVIVKGNIYTSFSLYMGIWINTMG